MHGAIEESTDIDLFPVAWGSSAHGQAANQMITVSPDGKSLWNSITNQRVFLTGDSPQLLSLQLASNSDVNTYLSTEQRGASMASGCS